MNNIQKYLDNLSVEKRELLLQKLQMHAQISPIGKANQIAPIESVSRERVLPLSFAQQRLWFLDRLEEESVNYNMSAAVRLAGSLQVPALEQAIGEIVQRHEILRTNFQTINGTAVQVIAPTLITTLTIMDLQTLTGEEQSTEIQRLAKEEAHKPFNLANDPLLRVTLLQLKPEEHMLFLTMHHIISDGWSIEIFFREMTACYAALLKGSPALLSKLPIQYADFACWQRQRLQGELLENGLRYWQQQLAGAPPLLSLLTDYPRPQFQTFQGNVECFQIDPNLTKKLNSLSRQSGVTLFMTLLTAFATLLCRYSNQSDIMIGSPIANRNRRELENLIGFFVNTLLLRINIEGDPSFLELLNRVRQVALDAYSHQEIPFEKLVEELNPSRSLSYNPLFQVMFALQNTPQPKLELTGLHLTLEMENVTANFDLCLSMEETEQGLLGVWEYNTDLFDTVTIKQMVRNFQTLLAGIIASPQQQISELPLLTAAEKQQLLMEWNNVQIEYPQDRCIHHLIESQVERTPDAVAVVFENQRLTYQELNCQANQLAHHLQSLGVGSEVQVGVCVERSLKMIVGLLGILKAGGAYIPLDPNYPKERLKYMLSSSQVPVLLTQSKLVDKLPEQRANLVCLDTDWEIISQQSKQNPIDSAGAENLAYVIYTSGSTGTPKGVMVTHQNLVNAYIAWEEAYQLRSLCHSHLQMASFSFDVFSGDMVRALCSGAKLLICPREYLLEPENLYELMIQENVDCGEFVPAVLRNLIQYLERTQQKLDFMRLLIVGSDSWYVQEYQQFKYFLSPKTRLINSYGVSEATIDSSYFETDMVDRYTDGLVPIGHSFANTNIYILDRHLQPVPIGVPGELYLGGNGVVRGYLNQPELTKQKFIDNPFSTGSGTRLYKTGDLARYLHDGNIEFLGRIDNQVKIRGFRIELGEIDSILTQNLSVLQTVTVDREDGNGNKQLVAYIVPQQGSTLNCNELRRFLQDRLPDYMIPHVFVPLETLPLTPNGKVNLQALPTPDLSQMYRNADFVPPSTFTEEILAKFWAEVLGVETVGIHDNFFELGGDSILSIQVVARANQAGVLLTPKQLFQHQTIAELAAVASETPQIHAKQGLITGQVQLTPIQHWFFAENPPEPHHYNQSVLLEVLPDLRPELLEPTLQQLLAHHDALRLKFVPSTSGWHQVNASVDEIPVSFTVVDLAELSASRQLSEIEASAAELQTSLDLLNGSIFKAVLFQLGQDKPGRLLLVIHHLAIDGVSWRILLEDLATVYQQLSDGETVKLPRKTTSFQDWSYRLAEYGKSGAINAEWDYWLNRPVSTTIPLRVDYSLPKETNTVNSAAQVSVSLSEQQTRALLQDVPPIYNTQINDVLLAALWQTFFQWTGEHSLLIDLESHGREELFLDVDLSRTVGWFTAVFPVQLNLGKIDHPEEILKSVKEQLRHIPQQGIGYGILRYLSSNAIKKSQLTALQQAEVSFNYLGQLDRSLSKSPLLGIAKESCGAEQSHLQNRSYLLEVNCYIVDRQLQMDWVYSKNIHQQSTINHLAQGFIDALKSFITHCQSAEIGYTPSDFPAARLNQKELDKLAAKINSIK